MSGKSKRKGHKGVANTGQEHEKENPMEGGAVKVHGAIEIHPSQRSAEQHIGERKEDNAHKELTHSHENASRTIALITLTVTALYLGVTAFIFLQSRRAAAAAEKANETTTKALTSVQRAFVFERSEQEVTVFGPPGNQLFQITFRFENAGTTPTRNLKSHLNWRFQHEPMDQNFPFADLGGRETPAVLGPKGYFGLSTDSLPTKILDEIVASRIHFYVWGWAKYNDVFENTPQHVTRFCSEMFPIAASMDKRTTLVDLKYRFNNCPYFNCADEDCKE
jgi:hypothetical protein